MSKRSELAALIRKNGFPKTRMTFFKFDVDNTTLMACALGQAAFNAGIIDEAGAREVAGGIRDHGEIWSGLDERFGDKLIARVYSLNDNDSPDLSMEEIADRIEKLPEIYG